MAARLVLPADRLARVVVGFVDRSVLAVWLPFDQDGQCLGIADTAHGPKFPHSE